MTTKRIIWNSNFIILFLLSLFLFINNTIYTSIASTYIAGIHANSALGGMANSANAIPALICRMIAGKLLDTGKRKKIIYGGLIGFGISALGYMHSPGVGAFFLFRAIDGAAFSVATTACQTIATDVIPKDKLAVGLSYYSMSAALSQALSATIAISAWKKYGFEALPATSFGILFLCMILSRFFLRITSDDKQAERRPILPEGEEAGCRGIWKVIEKKSLKSAALMFCISIFSIIRMLYVPRFIIENNIGNAGIYFFVLSGSCILVKIGSDKLTASYPLRRLLQYSMICNGFSFLLTIYMKNPAAMIAAAILGGIATGMDNPIVSASAVQNTEKSRRGVANGTFLCGNDIAMILGSTLWGGIINKITLSQLFFVAAIGLFTVAAAYRTYTFYKRFSPEDERIL